MNKNLHNILGTLAMLVACGGAAIASPGPQEAHKTRAKYIIDMVYNNLGLPPRISEFNNPEYVKEMGFNGMAPHWYVQCAITYDSLEEGLIPEGSADRKWIQKNADELNKKIKEAKNAGVELYPFTDFLVVPDLLWAKYGKDMVAEEFRNKVTPENPRSYRKPDINQETTQRIIRLQIAEIFETFPDLDGLTLRFGETYLHDTPFHLGDNPVKSQGREGIDGHIQLIKLLREEVCVKRNKKLFYRTWDFGDFFHTNPEVYLAITNEIEPHENLVFSVKHTKGDYLRTFLFNPTLSIGRHQQIVEVQCEREYEGKGAHANYIAKSVLDGFEEYDYLMEAGQAKCLNDIKNSSQFAGLWTWSRGGGWLGPNIKNEFWCELNTYVLSKWAQDTSRTEEEIFAEFAKSKGFPDDDIPKLREVSLLSVKAVLRGHYTKYLGGYNVFWTRDEFINGAESGQLKGFFDRAIAGGLVEEVLAEKRESVDMWRKIVELSNQIITTDEKLNEFLVSSAEYGRIKYEIIENGWIVMLLGHIGDKTGEYDKERIGEAITRYDELWDEWKQLEKDSPSCASIYQPNGFDIRGHLEIYGNPATGIGASVDQYRNL